MITNREPQAPSLGLAELTFVQKQKLSAAKRYCQEQSIRHCMEKQELQTKEFMQGGINNGTAQSQQVMSLMSQVFIGSIFYEVTEGQLRDAFSPYGQIKVVNLNLDPMTGKHKGFAFIWYDIPEAAQLAIEVMNSASMWGRPIKVGRPTQAQPYLKTIESTVIDSKKSTCIYVSSIHEEMEENDVREIFAPFGEIVNMDMSKDEISRTNKGYAFIEYKTVKEANDALQSMNLFELCGKQLRIGKAISPPFELGGKKKPVGEIGVVIPKLAGPISS